MLTYSNADRIKSKHIAFSFRHAKETCYGIKIVGFSLNSENIGMRIKEIYSQT